MLKYASKLLLEMSLSVLATVISAYVAGHYVGGKSPADVSALSVSTQVDSKESDASAASRTRETVSPPPPVAPSSRTDPSLAAADAGELSLKTIDDIGASNDKAGMSVDKRAEVASRPTRLQSTARDTHVSRVDKATAAAPAGASPTFAIARNHASLEQVFAAKEGSSTGRVLEPWEADRDVPVRLTPESIRKDRHFVGRILGPMTRKALLLLRKPADLLRHEGNGRERWLAEHLALNVTRPDAPERRSFGAKGGFQRAPSETAEP
ncbi:hypothetical protein SAMN05444164_2463 [Bradyrhizobium erythrophlei]|uniref:Uncharacterized protein n=1 Tax=Bradyrhizobium erythrophlei TaxID=1437360 RepID=A0A1H4UJQ2_9BRAD|nr:hypothetical protein SAMN05444164_2463 [Bradyrhizobium erythrophlei]